MKFVEYVEQASKIKDTDGKKINISILRSYTCENIEPILKTKLSKLGLIAKIEFGIFNQYYQEAIDKESFLYKNNSDIVIILVRTQELFAKIYEIQNNEKLQTNNIEKMVKSIKENSNAKAIIFANMDEYEYEANGILEYNDTNSVTSKIKDFNANLVLLKEKYSNLYLIDINRIIRNIGEISTYNDKMKYISKDPYKIEFYDELSTYLERIIDKVFNPSKKVLVVDMDNTLYKGILGEDELEKITDFNSYPNAFYKEFQVRLKNLKDRGVLLCIASKNNYDDVEKLFQTRKMHLKLEDFAIIKANWEDKYKNIQEIAQELNLDLNSFVFIDDSQYEIEMVNKMLPQVKTITIPKKAEEIKKILDNIYYFDMLNITLEDKRRTQLYRQKENIKFDDIDDIDRFLCDLKIEVEFKKINIDDKDLINRASQMTLKTNQFNMTTKRYTTDEIENIISNPNKCICMMFVKDKFGDNGSSGLFILNENKIDTFLLSCRVLKRKLEYIMLNHLKCIAKNNGYKELIAKFIPTQKNKAFETFYKEAGMNEIEENVYIINTEENIRNNVDYIKIKNGEY